MKVLTKREIAIVMSINAVMGGIADTLELLNEIYVRVKPEHGIDVEIQSAISNMCESHKRLNSANDKVKR